MNKPTKEEMLKLINSEIEMRKEGLIPDEKELKKRKAPKWMINSTKEFRRELEILEVIHLLIEKVFEWQEKAEKLTVIVNNRKAPIHQKIIALNKSLRFFEEIRDFRKES